MVGLTLVEIFTMEKALDIDGSTLVEKKMRV